MLESAHLQIRANYIQNLFCQILLKDFMPVAI